jgi:hypothetical protein
LPALHDGAALQSCIHIPADGIPRFAAELSVHQVIEIVLLRCPFEQDGITWFEKRAWARLGVSQIFLLEIRKALRFQYGYPAFVLHRFSFLPFI